MSYALAIPWWSISATPGSGWRLLLGDCRSGRNRRCCVPTRAGQYAAASGEPANGVRLQGPDDSMAPSHWLDLAAGQIVAE
jgi:hypothetical protein